MPCNPGDPLPTDQTEPLPPTIITVDELVPETGLPYIVPITPDYIFLTFPISFTDGSDPNTLYGNSGATFNYTCTTGDQPIEVMIPPNTYQVMGSQSYADYLAEQAATQAATLQCEIDNGGSYNPAVGDFGNTLIDVEVFCAE